MFSSRLNSKGQHMIGLPPGSADKARLFLIFVFNFLMKFLDGSFYFFV